MNKRTEGRVVFLEESGSHLHLWTTPRQSGSKGRLGLIRTLWPWHEKSFQLVLIGRASSLIRCAGCTVLTSFLSTVVLRRHGSQQTPPQNTDGRRGHHAVASNLQRTDCFHPGTEHAAIDDKRPQMLNYCPLMEFAKFALARERDFVLEP